MSTVTRTSEDRTADRSVASEGPGQTQDRMRRWVSLGATLVVLAWSTVELISLALDHTDGPEIYGVLVALVAVGTGVLSLALLSSNRRRLWACAALLGLWAVIALGGVAGTLAHVIGPMAGHGLVDLRPRPLAAPLIFTAFGLVGAAALSYGQRLGALLHRGP